MNKPVIIGICGGTGSGKTTVAREILSALPQKNVSIIHQDAYYKLQTNKTFEQRTETNYDHPFAFDTDLLLEHLTELTAGRDIDMPIYDFANHNRSDKTTKIHAREIIILEGILILEDKRLRNLMDIKIFVDTDTDVRIIRRITRDMNERGRSLESVIEQYLATVKPAHEQFIEPSKKYADIIIPEGGFNTVAIDIMVGKIKTILD
ncbi:MAG: uridine kinase [Clostridiales bacterium]|nr:uridine kinase [Clostridiales bacterium]